MDLTSAGSYDREHLWHPYSSMTHPTPAYHVDSATGVTLRLSTPDGPVEAVDAMASWWCAIHGYAVPELDAAASAQLARMSHVMFGGLTHEPAVGLARRLVDLTPDPLQHVFFADSGSVAVEVALKMAWQAHARGGVSRHKIFTLRGGYHGDTFAAMSVCDPDGGMHAMYTGLVPDNVFAPRPPGGLDRPADDPEMQAWESETRALFAEHVDEIAAVILEPVLQGAGGMHIYSPHAVRVLAQLARESGALVIFDEIATGFWRTGTRWALDRCGVVPDLLCLGKALTGGYLSLAAVLTTPEVAAAVDASPAGAMMHGPTFMANPLACAVATASIDLLEGGDPAGATAHVGAGLMSALSPARDLPSVVDVRGIGAVGVVELDRDVDIARLTRASLDRGVWVRPFRNLVYAMPPYVTSDQELARIGEAIVAAIAEVHP